ncbi:F-box protein At2g16365-like [Nicotiana sylvestris]|uniref:F-box protein At2g16365-like n=1 Tax=Nicotiana sylvestris TaxID=4096 RepID=A0A1U7VNG4_NICSY|nr:PREDICTED: F-box protein At2g16365-like [Nicotiana sylvestris]XP_009766502.1 PREDICTED: F-box protein At2g16365-like [Nicotiana sylvestris]
MSDRVTQSYSDCDGRAGKSTHSVQSVWMAHWTRTSYNATAETHNHVPSASANKENDQDSKLPQSIVKLETVSRLSKSIKRLRESETQAFEVVNETLRTSSRTIANETLGCRSIVAPKPLPDNPIQYITREGEKMRNPFIRSFLAAKDEVPRLGMLEPEHYNYHNNSASLVCEEKLNDQQKLPHPLHDVETMRKSNTMDPVRGLAGYYPRISQTTHSLLITKRTDANLLEGNKAVGNSRMWTEFNGKNVSLSDNDSPSKSFGHYKGEMKLQLLDCSKGSEGKENIEASKRCKVVLKNESSAETDTMDMDVFREKNQLCGTSSSIVKKVNKMDQKSPPRSALDCSRKEAGRKRFNLDINLELPAPTDNAGPSSSRTESLDLELVLAHAERPTSSRTDLCPEGLLGQDPGSRWVKRLKVGASGSLAFGTKRSSLIGESSHEKAHKFLSKMTKATLTSSEPTSSKPHGKELMAHDNSSSSSMSVIKKDLEVLTSHSWIQRLLRDGATATKKRPAQPVVVCEPQSSKLETDDCQKKQLPSLGAMALMGKAMNGFQPCEFHRRGPLVVWNTGSF